MRDAVVMEYPWLLIYVPGWFVTQELIKIWHDDDELIGFDEGHKKRKAQKAQIKKELMPIAGHPLRWCDWCVSEDEKKETEKLWE